MAGFWERIFDPPSPEKNQHRLDAARRQMTAINRRQSKTRQQQKAQDDKVRRLQEDLQTSQAQVESLQADLDRLTRCLFANNVIEQADLDAMLPQSEVQDSGE